MKVYSSYEVKIYLLCVNVDLGYHALAAFHNKDECQKELDEMVKQHYADGWTWKPEFLIEEVDLK
jgi:hypothetical protein